MIAFFGEEGGDLGGGVSERAQIKKQNRLNVGRIDLERLVGALMNRSLLQSGGGRSLNGTNKFNSGLQITTLEVNIIPLLRFKVKNGTSFGALFNSPPIEFSCLKL